MSTTALLLGAIVTLTLAELAAVIVIALYSARDQITTLVGILIGIVGPIVASLVAVVVSANAHAKAEAAQTKADQVEQAVNGEAPSR